MSRSDNDFLFILGAGASMDFGFPSGMALMEEIYCKWRDAHDEWIQLYLRILRKAGKPAPFGDDLNIRKNDARKKIDELANRLYYSGATSIDDFLSQVNDPEDKDFGKLTIIKLILGKEAGALSMDPKKGLFKFSDNWLRILFARVFRDEPFDKLKEKLKRNKIKFITFNYDRCLEHFLFQGLKNYYNLSDEQAKEIFQEIFIDHVYGQLGNLDWQGNETGGVLNFGEKLGDKETEFDKIYRCKDNIKVINEDRNNSKKYSQTINKASRVHMLGFGFDDANLNLLELDQVEKIKNKFLYTTFGLSNSLKESIHKRFGKIYIGAAEQPGAVAYEKNICEYMFHDFSFDGKNN